MSEEQAPYNVPSLAAGREMDALIAEQVMGCTIERRKTNIYCGCEMTSSGFPHAMNIAADDEDNDLAHYSTDIAAAWQVVEKLDLFCEHQLQHRSPVWAQGRWFIYRKGIAVAQFQADTAPMVICLAALKAIAEPGPGLAG